MSIISVKAEPDQSKAELLAWIQTQEATYGEIARIGNEDGFTLGSFHRFDPDHPRPGIEAGMKRLPKDAPKHDGELCRGTVYISGELDPVVVFRPAA
jgi:hypothetical protein